MLLTKFSNLQIVHIASTNQTVADIHSRYFSQITIKTCQLQRKTIPPHIEIMRLKPDNAVKQIHCLFKHEDVLPTQKSDFHPIPNLS